LSVNFCGETINKFAVFALMNEGRFYFGVVLADAYKRG